MPNGPAVNNSNAQTAVVVTANDQAGNKDASYNGWATLAVSGPATLLGGSSTSENVWIGAGQSNPIYVVGKQGVTGNVVVTVTATGLATQTFTIPAYVQTGAASIVATASASSVAPGSPVTVTVKELDVNGNLAVNNSAGAANNDVVTLSNDSVSGSVVVPASVTLKNGIGTFTVTNNGFIGSANVNLNDGLLTGTLPLAFTTGSAAKGAPVVSAVYAPEGSTQTVTFQLEDAAGNAVKVAGDTFNLTAPGATLSATSATTDSNGQFSVQVTLPNTDNTGIAVQASASGFATATETVTTRVAANLATTVSDNVYVPSTATNESVSKLSSLQAGQTVNLDVYGMDAVGLPVGQGDSFTVSSSNSNIALETAALLAMTAPSSRQARLIPYTLQR